MAGTAPTDWLGAALIYLAAAVLAVPLAKRPGLGAILGYLVAGIAIGPWGLRLVADAEAVLHVAEFGVVLMLFLVGPELEPRRLWQMRQAVFGWGSLQLLGSGALLMGLGLAFGLAWPLAQVGALALAMSSTAIGLGALAERNLLPTPGGQSVLAGLLAQDIAAPSSPWRPGLAPGKEPAGAARWCRAFCCSRPACSRP